MVKRYELGLYEKSMPNFISLDKKMDICKSSGFDFLELSIDESDEKLQRLDWDLTTIKNITNLMIDKNIRIKSICLSGHRKYPLGSHVDDIRKKSLEIMFKAIDLAYKLGVRVIQIAGYDVYYEESDEKSKELFLENLKLSVQYASKKNVILAFETMETDFMDNVEKSLKYVNIINSPYLKIYPDLGNCKNSSLKNKKSLIDDLKKGQGNICAVHLKETLPNIYREVRFGEGHTNFIEGIEVFKEMGVNSYVGEFWYTGEDNWKEEIKYSSEFLRDKLDNVY